MQFTLTIDGGRVLAKRRLHLHAAITTAKALAAALAKETSPDEIAALALRHQQAVARIVPTLVQSDARPDLDRAGVLAQLHIAEDGAVTLPGTCVVPAFDAVLGQILANCLFTNALIVFMSTDAMEPGFVKAARVDEDGTVTPLLLTLSAPDGTPLYELEQRTRWGSSPNTTT